MTTHHLEKEFPSPQPLTPEQLRIKELEDRVEDLQTRLRVTTTHAYALRQELLVCQRNLRHSREMHKIIL